ncbi:hypothetical protein DIPPA_33152 [Diplonema papillatum]|nr:hypothetical protein DIPPA_33152 [Diplonema papillatum]
MLIGRYLGDTGVETSLLEWGGCERLDLRALRPAGKVLKAAEWKPAAPVAGDDVRVRLLCAPILAHDVQMIMGTYGGYKAEEYSVVAGTEGVGAELIGKYPC